MHPTTDIPQPYHRWSANEDAGIAAFSTKDRCLVKSNSVAAGPCPQKDWRLLSDAEMKPYLIAYIDKPTTRSQRELLAWAQR